MKNLAVMFKSLAMLIPAVAVERKENLRGERTVHDGTHFPQRSSGACCQELHGYVSESRRLSRACQNLFAGSVSSELVQKTVFRPPADHTDCSDWSANQVFEIS